MFLPIKVEMQIGEMAAGYSFPYLDDSGKIQYDRVQAFIEKVDRAGKKIKFENYTELIGFHRIESFTFGGIKLINDLFDHERLWDENKKIVGKMKK